MTFSEVDQHHQELKQQSLAGTLTDEQFDDALHEMMVQDSEGRWWAKSREQGEWHFYDAISTNWVRAEPPKENAWETAVPPQAGVLDDIAPLQPGTPAEVTAPPDPLSDDVAPVPAEPGANHALPRWASRAPQSAQAPAPVSPAVPEVAGTVRPRPPAAAGFGPLPELGTALKVIFYLLSFFIPLAGFILFFVYRNKPAQQDRAAARTFLILGCLGTVAYGALAAWLVAVS
jgi:cytochrome bd-type quinol oxidase subunit 1